MNAAVHICIHSTMYLGTIISAALLFSFSVSSSNECPRINQQCQGKTWKYNESRLDKIHTVCTAPLGPTIMGTKNLNKNGPDPSLFSGTKNMVRANLMATVLFWTARLSLFMRGKY